ncbi:MAG: response regulator transcription factor [Desulfosarcina sp.]|jgi:two-component system response regulator NreC
MKTQPSSVVIVTTEARRAAIDSVIDALGDIVMITEPADAKAVVKQVHTAAARVVVLDSGIDGLEWPTAVYEMTHLDKPPRVIVLGEPDKASLLSAFREGADAYLNHGSVTDELIPVLNAVGAGRVAFNRNDADTIRDHMRYLELGAARNVAHIQNGISTLTVREKEVFPLLADGYSIKTTARTLGISPKTVETHKYHIMKKLNLDNMADFTKLAMIKDLIPI